MSGKYRFVNQWYYWGWEDSNATNDAADEIIRTPDRHLLSQEALFNAQGGWATVGLSLGLTAFGTLLVFGGSPRTSAHWRMGNCSFQEWACLLSSGVFWYCGGQMLGNRVFGEHQRLRNHWMAYTFVKSQNRYEGRRILTKAPTY